MTRPAKLNKPAIMAALMRTESFVLEAKGGTAEGKLRGQVHRPKSSGSDLLLPGVLLCRGAALPGDHAQSLLDDLIKGMCETGACVATYEPRCTDLILEDFHSYCVEEDWADATAALNWLSSQPGVSAARLGVVGYSLGAAAAAYLAHDKNTARVCLLAPAPAGRVEQALKRGNGQSLFNADELPDCYLSSLAKMDFAPELVIACKPALIVHGAADRFIPPEVSREIALALENAQRESECLLIARGDHTFSHRPARQVCIEVLAEYFALKNPVDAPRLTVGSGA